jgi:Cu/Ag efflux protein CusF
VAWTAVGLMALVLACRGPTTYPAVGDVIAIDDPPRHVTISHDDIPGLMPAMTMTLPLRSAAVLAGITPGMRVRFLLVRDGTPTWSSPRWSPWGSQAAAVPACTTTRRTTAAW